MRPIVLQRETEGERERARPSQKLKGNWTESELNSGREESDKRNRHGSVFCPIALLDVRREKGEEAT